MCLLTKQHNSVHLVQCGPTAGNITAGLPQCNGSLPPGLLRLSHQRAVIVEKPGSVASLPFYCGMMYFDSTVVVLYCVTEQSNPSFLLQCSVLYCVTEQSNPSFLLQCSVLCCVTEQSDPSFLLQCSVQLWQSLQRCWDSDVYLMPLCHRFWKLTLQLVSRYATWLAELQDEVCEAYQLSYTALCC